MMQSRPFKGYLSTLVATIFSIYLIVGCTTTNTQVNQDSDRAEALRNMGNALVQQGKLREGLSYLIKAEKVMAPDPNLHHELAIVYRDLGEYDLSLKQFKRALELNPNFSDARNNLGTLYLLMEKWDQAIESFQLAIDDILYKTPDIAYNNMGLAYHNKEEYDKAINCYLKAIKSFPSYASCYTNLGLAYEMINRWEKAADAYKKSIQYDPKNSAPYVRLGNIYYELHMKKDAVDILKQLLNNLDEGEEAERVKKLINKIEAE